jgi:hypothetical protein
MFKHLKYPVTILFSLTLVVLLTAFGCKKETTQQNANSSSENINGVEQITYEQTAVDNTQSNNSNESGETNNNSTENNTNSNENKTDNSEVANNDEKLLLEKAEKLAEIYGTYTNKDKETYNNLKSLKQYSTDKLNSWLDQKSKVPINSKAAFYGVTTSALSSIFLEQSGSKNKILVTAKKEEISASSNTPRISYKIIILDFEKVEEVWKLSGIYWQS